MRVVPGGEIIHIIAIRSTTATHIGKKAFDILIGAATVYRRKINLDVAPTENINWIKFIDHYFRREQYMELNRESLSRMQPFQFPQDSQ